MKAPTMATTPDTHPIFPLPLAVCRSTLCRSTTVPAPLGEEPKPCPVCSSRSMVRLVERRCRCCNTPFRFDASLTEHWSSEMCALPQEPTWRQPIHCPDCVAACGKDGRLLRTEDDEPLEEPEPVPVRPRVRKTLAAYERLKA
jgi:hypothetical protein